ncbi:RagB/SusD family nutrient uptake outer membrane protein [Flagellimonas onchidii]|uniref:RagB/SusD family nutrient uptake outer membrane protein n=1 Tax=Flagellimonas onchidii TaxID=2562684 RepID=UPI0010A6AAEB|nr:RagB/SusD family nutrient uptake outer membrane protein [Allomuricauda onchidii]
MKYFNIKIVALLFLLNTTVSCDDYVDIEPQGFAIPVSAIELDLVLESGQSFDLRADQMYSRLLTDDTGWTFDFQEFFAQENPDDIHELNFYRFLPEPIPQGQSDPTWNQVYATIGQTNFVLDFIDEVEATDSERSRIKAEALAARALSYFVLVNTYGQPYTTAVENDEDSGVPIIIGTFGDTGQSLKRATLKEVYELIIEDLEEAITLFPADLVSNNFRLSKVAAYAILARTYLVMGQYAMAGEAADEALAIKDNLLDYNTDLLEGEVFDFSCFCFVGNDKFEEPVNHENPEMILNRGLIFAPGFFNQNTFEFISTTILSPDLEAIFDQTNDLRYARRTSDGTFGRILNETDNAFNGIRVSEVWLIKAEAEARTGDFGQAMSIINNLRAKRFDTAVVAADGHILTATNQTEAIQHILEERRRELMFTTSRLIDIRRLNALENANISVTHVVGDGVTETLGPNDNRWTYAIYSDVIDMSNGEIVQNPR